MLARVRRRFTYANVTATLALVFAMTGGAVAATVIRNSKQIKTGVVNSGDVRNNSLTSTDLRNGRAVDTADLTPGLLAQVQRAGGVGPAGPTGPAGPKGDTGAKGDKGDPGDPTTGGRIAFVNRTSDSGIGAATTDYATATITAPARGLLYVQTAATLISSVSATCPCVVQTRLVLDDGAPQIVNNANLGEEASSYVGGFERQPTAGGHVYTVDAGEHTVKAQAQVQTSSGFSGLGTSNETLQVLFVPFDGTGATP